jgi:hypothetical protein
MKHGKHGSYGILAMFMVTEKYKIAMGWEYF